MCVYLCVYVCMSTYVHMRNVCEYLCVHAHVCMQLYVYVCV